jgi:hypothetical protein
MITLNVPDMSCGHCKATVEKAVAGVDPVTRRPDRGVEGGGLRGDCRIDCAPLLSLEAPP